jgi:DNA polymerase-3 subunit chi
MSGELWFYHLEQSSLEEVLPELLEKTLARGWRALVRAGDDDRLKALDQVLWTWRDDSFTAHGRASDDDPERQPVLLSVDETNRNGAQCLFLLDGVTPVDVGAFERTIVMFDGQDESAVQGARRLWKREAGEGRPVSYWRQSPEGRWEKKA